MSELKKKTISGLIWTFTQQFSIQIVNFIASIVLARILMPAEFGLIGMITVFIAIGRSLVNGGMSSSLIRTTNPDDQDYSTVFYANLILSFVVYLIVFVAAPFIASFFEQPILILLIRVYSLTFIINAFSIVQSTKLNKSMDFKTQLIINLPSIIIASVLGITLAYKGFGVWSLVWMQLVQVFLATLQLWFYSKWKPLFVFNKLKFKTHFKFGYKLTLSGIMNSLISNSYNIILGKLFPPAELGFYTRAKSLQELPVNNVTLALNKVTYPMFAMIKNDDVKLKAVYKRLISQVFFWVVPLLVVAIIIAEPLFNVLLTSKWLPAAPYFQILCLAGIAKPLSLYNLNILLVKGDSKKYFKLEMVKNTFIVLGALLVIPYGIYGMLWGLVLASYLTFFINAVYCGSVISYGIMEQLRGLFKVFVLALLIGIVGHFLGNSINNYFQNDLIFIGVLSFFLLSLYIFAAYLFKIAALNDFFTLFKGTK